MEEIAVSGSQNLTSRIKSAVRQFHGTRNEMVSSALNRNQTQQEIAELLKYGIQEYSDRTDNNVLVHCYEDYIDEEHPTYLSLAVELNINGRTTLLPIFRAKIDYGVEFCNEDNSTDYPFHSWKNFSEFDFSESVIEFYQERFDRKRRTHDQQRTNTNDIKYLNTVLATLKLPYYLDESNRTSKLLLLDGTITRLR